MAWNHHVASPPHQPTLVSTVHQPDLRILPQQGLGVGWLFPAAGDSVRTAGADDGAGGPGVEVRAGVDSETGVHAQLLLTHYTIWFDDWEPLRSAVLEGGAGVQDQHLTYTTSIYISISIK